MTILSAVSRLIDHPAAMRALLLWPQFSLTSFIMLSSLRKQGILPATVIDVGANVGQFAVAAAKFFPFSRIHSFEPLPDCYSQLEKSCSKLTNIKTYLLALGECEGEVIFHVNTHRHSSSILPLADTHKAAFPDAVECKDIKVRMTTLDEIFADVPLQPPVLLKLDVQGYESQVLTGANRSLMKVNYVILEASFRPMYEGEMPFLEVISFMGRLGFTFLRPIGWLSDPKTCEVIQADLLFRRDE